MKTMRYLPIFFAAVLAAFSCQKEVLVQVNDTFESQLFIESMLYPGEIPKVYLSRTNPFFSRDVTPQETFARDALVEISDGGGVVERLQADSTFDKFRCRWVPYYGGLSPTKYGETYHLKVACQGKTYSASTTIDQPKVQIEHIEYTPEFFDVYGGHDGVRITFRDAPGPGNFYRFQMNRMIDSSRYHAHILDVLQSHNNCTNGEKFLVVDLGRTIFSDDNIDGQKLEVNVEVSFEYREGDSTYIFMQSLDATSAAFFDDLDQQLQSILNPFVEPVFLRSTIEGALGVFGSAVRSDSVLFIYPQDNP